MKVKFISTASVIISTDDCVIWTDPWTFGKAFNNSWVLFPEVPFDPKDYDRITHVWVSHEHPDHFHIPTLKSLPSDFKKRVTLLFQQNHSDKMPNAFRKMLGFENIQLIENRKITPLTENTKIQVVQVGSMDSTLAVMEPGFTLLNINDCEVSKTDCQNFAKDLGKIDLALNQFSVAGYNGYYDYKKLGPISAAKIIDNLVWNHKEVGAKVTMPFASNIRFCCEDNKHINTFANTPQDVWDRFEKEDLECMIMYPGEEFDSKEAWDSQLSLKKFNETYKTLDSLPCDPIETKTLEEVEKAFKHFSESIRDRYPRWIYKKLGNVKVEVPDLKGYVEISVRDNTFNFYNQNDEKRTDLIINSQPLHFAFINTWGIQTLGISGRFLVLHSDSPWKWYRIVSSMNNSEVYLSMKYFFSKKTLQFIRQTFRQGLMQFIHQWRVRVTNTQLDQTVS
ncbi:MAG: MBL fold metallo-hydrolase [Flavobacteriales bacterium]|nr:MBL fold metallo-hydrolase [Flavobacteriales bacterium]